MPTVRFTKEGLLSRKQLQAGWRLLTVLDFSEEAGKSDPTSTNYVGTFKVTGGPDDGVTIKNWFTMKREDLFSRFVECFTKDRTVDPDKGYNLDDLVGKQVEGYCQYDIQRQWNTIVDWRPVSRSQQKDDKAKDTGAK